MAEDARGGLGRSAQLWLYDRLDWFRATAALPGLGRPLVARAEGGGARAWLFLARCGRGATALASWYTLAFRPVFRDAKEEDQAALVAAAARALGKARLAWIALEPVPEWDGSAALLAHGFAAAGWRVEAAEQTGNWFAIVDGLDFATYWAARPGRLRSTVRRKAKAAPVAIEIFHDFREQAWDAYRTVYAASWKPTEGSLSFLRAMAEREGAAGTLRLGIARRDGRPVAAQLWTSENQYVTIHKLAHVAEEKRKSPGTLLSHAMFRHVMENEQPVYIDYGTGDDAYKADWMGNRRALMRIDCANPRTLAGRLRLARALAAKLVRSLRSG